MNADAVEIFLCEDGHTIAVEAFAGDQSIGLKYFGLGDLLDGEQAIGWANEPQLT